MKRNDIINFFNSAAPTWDSYKQETDLELDNLLKILPIKTGDKILDIGCGTGIITNNLYKLSKKTVLGIDISDSMINIAKQKKLNNKNVDFLCCDFTKYNGSDYDFAIIFNAFPHFIDRKALKTSFLKVLKKGGKFAILHNLSIDELEEIHKDMSPLLSRKIDNADIEAKFFEPEFKIIEAREDKHLYYILAEKL